MKTLLALTVLTLTCFLKHSSANPVAIDMVIKNVECCEAVTNKIYIPVYKVTNVTMASDCKLKAIIVTNKIYIPVYKVTNVTMASDCKLKAIIVTILKKKLCLDPEWKHAQMHLEEFKKRSAPTTLKPETTKEMKKNFSSTTLKPTTT